MKKTTLTTKFKIILMVGIFLAGSAFAGNIKVNQNGSTKFKITESSYTELNFNNSVSDIEFVPVKTKEGYFTLLRIDDYAYSMLNGEPKLPVLKRLIEVPLNATCEVEIISSDINEINLYDHGITNYLMPAQPSLNKSANPDDVDFMYNKSSYLVDDFLGSEVVKIVDLGVMRGVRLARVEIAPLSYNPVQNSVKVYENLKIRVNFSGADVNATIQQKAAKHSPYFASNFQHISNYKPLDTKELITDEPVTYIIVSDPMFEDALQPFIEWKTKKGFQVVEAYTDDPNVGSTTTSIKNYLDDFYVNPPEGYNSQSFVLICGDVAQVPTFSGTAGGHVSDLYYHEYTGDLYPECFYGRFSATSVSQLEVQINKTLEYEQYLFPDPSFLDNVVMIAGADGSYGTLHGNGQINYGTNYYFNEAHGINSHTYLQPEPSGGNYSANIIQNINDGVSFANYTAHCSTNGWADPSFVISHIPSLTNESMYPLMVGNCCSSVEFQTTCFGEEVLRANNKGAIGYIGGSNSTYWDEDYWWGVGAEAVSSNPTYVAGLTGVYDGAFHDLDTDLEDWFITQGQMVQSGCLAVTEGGGNETYYWEIYHLMGDPSLMIYFGQGDEPTANYQGLMPLGSSTFTVNTDAYSYVAISKDGELAGAAIADETGVAEVEMFNPISVPGLADVVITGQNLQPYIGTVTVASPEGAYVLFSELEIDDSDGNANGIIDFGETILLDVTLENFGQEDGTNLIATLSTDDMYVSIDNDTYDWPNIPGGSTSMEEGAFTFTVNDIIEDQHFASFEMDITDGTDTWTSTFNLILNAPVLTIGSYSIDDSQGDNNGRLDPGETADIIFVNGNEGGCDALQSVVNAVTSSPLITLNTSTFEIGTIASGGVENAVLNITVDPSAQVGDVAELQYTLESDPYSVNTAFNLSIGLIVEDFETGDFSAFAWEFDGNADWSVDSGDPYEGDYSAKSGSISDEQSTTLLLTADVATDDEISFYYKVSSESNYDYLRFYIDGVMKNEWSGDVNWAQASYDVEAGNHTFKWSYEKDYSVSNGDDCAWIDYILFPAIGGAAPLGVIISASPDEICAGESTQLSAFAMGGTGSYTYDWQPTTGLSDPTIANPVATPDVTTTYYIVVEDGDNTITDNITITVEPIPETPTISQSGNSLTSSSATGNQWFDSNGLIPGATDQTYMPVATDDYYVIVTNNGCESDASETYHFIYTGVIELEAGQQVNVYPNPFTQRFNIDYSLTSPSTAKFTVYNMQGQILTVVNDNEIKSTGNHRIIFDADKFQSGMYYIQIETSEYSIVKQVFRSK